MQEKQGLATAQVFPQPTPAVSSSDSFKMGEPFHPCRVLGQHTRNWEVESRLLKLTLFLPPSLALSLPSLFLTLVLFFLRGHRVVREHWGKPDPDSVPPLPIH